MNDTSYAYAVARLHAIENSLLSPSDMELLISAKSPSECMRILADKGYSGESANTSVEEIFANETKKMWSLINELAPDCKVLDIFLYKNDFHNLKVIMKGLAGGKPYDNLLMHPTTVEVSLITEAVSGKNFEILPQMMAKAADEAYYALTANGDPQTASVIIDTAYLTAFYNTAKESGDTFLIKLAALTVDNANVKTALRCSKIGKDTAFVSKCLVPLGSIDTSELATAAGGGFSAVAEFLSSSAYSSLLEESGDDFSVFEKLCDNLIMNHVRDAKYTFFGIKPIIGHIFAKETEIKALHIIVSGKLSGLDEEMLRGRLRMLYV